MSDARFFNFGEFITKRAFIGTIVGVILVALTEFLIPWLGILTLDWVWSLITPATIVLTIAVIITTNVIAKNVAAALIIATAAAISFYSPYASSSLGYVTIIVFYYLFALFSGFFAAKPMTGKAALLTIGLVFGIQGLIAAGISGFLSINGIYDTFNQQGITIAHGSNGSIPLFDIIFAAISLIYMIVFIILSTRSFSATYSSKAREIIGHIIIFLGIVAFLAIQVVGHVTLTNSTVRDLTSANDLQYLNTIFAKTTSGEFSLNTLLNVFYVLAGLGMVIGIGLALIIYQRAKGTVDVINFDLEGGLLILNLPLAIVLGLFSYPFVQFIGASYYMTQEAWYIVATEYTNLLLINIIVAYVILRIIAFIRSKISS